MKEIEADHRLALTGTPLENRMLDLWSIVDFSQPGYLGNQQNFNETYEAKGDGPEWDGSAKRRRLSAKLRPIMLRRGSGWPRTEQKSRRLNRRRTIWQQRSGRAASG